MARRAPRQPEDEQPKKRVKREGSSGSSRSSSDRSRSGSEKPRPSSSKSRSSSGRSRSASEGGEKRSSSSRSRSEGSRSRSEGSRSRSSSEQRSSSGRSRSSGSSRSSSQGSSRSSSGRSSRGKQREVAEAPAGRGGGRSGGGRKRGKKKGNGNMMLGIVVLVVIIAGVGGGIGFLALQQSNQRAAEQEEALKQEQKEIAAAEAKVLNPSKIKIGDTTAAALLADLRGEDVAKGEAARKQLMDILAQEPRLSRLMIQGFYNGLTKENYLEFSDDMATMARYMDSSKFKVDIVKEFFAAVFNKEITPVDEIAVDTAKRILVEAGDKATGDITEMLDKARNDSDEVVMDLTLDVFAQTKTTNPSFVDYAKEIVKTVGEFKDKGENIEPMDLKLYERLKADFASILN